MSEQITPFRIDIKDDQLEDLKRRLRATRWPEPECVDDWTQGLPLGYAQEVASHWLEKYDWRRCESRLNQFPQFKTAIDGLGIHFIHVRSPHPDATPLIMTHGWPGSIVEFHKVIEPLTNPTAHGGDAADAFHVVCPSLPAGLQTVRGTRRRLGRCRHDLYRLARYRQLSRDPREYAAHFARTRQARSEE
jgi:epoxide hydrolase